MKKIKALALSGLKNPKEQGSSSSAALPSSSFSAAARPCCALCGKTEDELDAEEKLRKYGGCGVARYCSGGCQKKAWRVHKKQCGR